MPFVSVCGRVLGKLFLMLLPVALKKKVSRQERSSSGLSNKGGAFLRGIHGRAGSGPAFFMPGEKLLLLKKNIL